MKSITIKIITIITLMALGLSLCACESSNDEERDDEGISDGEENGDENEDENDEGSFYEYEMEEEYYTNADIEFGYVNWDEIYITDEEKALWYDPIVKLISNQDEPYGEHGEIMGYEPPRPDEPSIAMGHHMGLFDVTYDGVPELLLNLGGGTAGNYYYLAYDIFSGDVVGQIEGGGDKAWNMYYDVRNGIYEPVGRYDWRIGTIGSEHFVTTIKFYEEPQRYAEKTLFFVEYEYEMTFIKDDDGKTESVDFDIVNVNFRVNGQTAGHQSYYFALNDFEQEHSLVPYTGLRLYRWEDVSDDDDSYQERAEKMASMLLYGSGQRFVRMDEHAE